MKIIIEIDTDNESFEENLGLELRDIFADAAVKAQSLLTNQPWGATERFLLDSSGNAVGKVTVTN